MDNMLERLVHGMQPSWEYTCQKVISETKGYCESPIENLLLSAWWMAVILLRFRFDGGFRLCNQQDMGNHEDDLFLCVPQFEWGSYRIDIAIVSKGFPSRFLFIECDGHEFHERTADQAAYDRSKDRAAQIAGIPILRFTGREIYRDCGECVRQILDAINGLWKRELQDG